MNKLSIFIATVILGAASISFGAEQQVSSTASTPAVASSSTPFRIGVWPGVWEWPSGMNVYGFSLGLPSTYDSGNEYVAGLDLAILESSSNVKGAQIALMITGKKSDGLQVSVANIVSLFDGVQIGVYNDFKDSAGLQIGVINKGTSSKGVQIGLINMLDNGFFPTFPLFNFSPSKK
ncbi:MAG TPA: hypothetical protein DD381_01075 [Lentisphaeria bacterium]|nr:MAG: hypothetical protein A2X47_05905 [Lentisphaerae bacterium GWF2_38_69]HBM14935.1 hypothetical protein [Lentisphaeria bacterium]